MKKLLLFLLLALPALAQVSPQIQGAGAPSNPCFNGGQEYVDTTNHVIYSCPSNGSNWVNRGASNTSGGGAASGGDTVSTYSITSAGAQGLVNLSGTSVDTHAISWRISGLSGLNVADTIGYSNGDLHTANANWTYQTGTFSTTSNVVYGSSATSLAYRSDGANTASEFAQERVVVTGNILSAQNAGPCVRVQTGAFTAYCIQLATNAFRISIWNAGVLTVLANFDASAPVSGDIVKITASGTTISGFKNGVLVGTASDAVIASGFTGMYSAGSATINGASTFQSGQIISCSIAVDGSADGTTWAPGLIVPAQDCTQVPGGSGSPNGSFQVSAISNYVRVNVSALTAGLTLTATYRGRYSPAPAAAASAVSNGQYVNAGEIIWTQLTSQGGVGTINVQTVVRLLLANGTNQNTAQTISSCVTANGGYGFGMVLSSPGWLQSVVSVVQTGGFPQGTFFINQYILPSMPSGGTSTSCNGVLNQTFASQVSTLLSGAPTGSFYPVSFVGTSYIPSSTWSIPGYTTTIAISNPSAGAEWSYTVPNLGGAGGGARTCIQSVSFTLASGSTGVNPVLVLTINGSKIVYAPATQQGSATTQTYSFSPGAVAEAVTAGSTLYHIVPFNNGQLACYNAGLSTATIGTLTTTINGTSQFSNISLLTQVQQDNN
jgi:hypothetical protein